MPGRPPKKWIRRCIAGVSAKGSADDPGAVCGAVWKRKSDEEKRRIVREEERSKRSRSKPARSKPRSRAASKSRKKPKRTYSARELKMIAEIRETMNSIRRLRGGRR